MAYFSYLPARHKKTKKIDLRNINSEQREVLSRLLATYLSGEKQVKLSRTGMYLDPGARTILPLFFRRKITYSLSNSIVRVYDPDEDKVRYLVVEGKKIHPRQSIGREKRIIGELVQHPNNKLFYYYGIPQQEMTLQIYSYRDSRDWQAVRVLDQARAGHRADTRVLPVLMRSDINKMMVLRKSGKLWISPNTKDADRKLLKNIMEQEFSDPKKTKIRRNDVFQHPLANKSKMLPDLHLSNSIERVFDFEKNEYRYFSVSTGGGALLGKGGFARVKKIEYELFLEDESVRIEKMSRPMAIKIVQAPEEELKRKPWQSEVSKEFGLATSVAGSYLPELFSLDSAMKARIIMEDKGIDLEAKLYENDESFTFSQALIVCYQLAKYMQYIHRLGIIHCDMKPANVMLNEQGEVSVVDMGLATRDPMGHAGTVCGTPIYMSSEIFPGGEYTPEYDIQATGAVMAGCLGADTVTLERDNKEKELGDLSTEDCEQIANIPYDFSRLFSNLEAEPDCEPTQQDYDELSNLLDQMSHKPPEERPDWETVIQVFEVVMKRHKIDYQNIALAPELSQPARTYVPDVETLLARLAGEPRVTFSEKPNVII